MITDDDMIQKMDAEEFTTMIDPFRNIQISLAGGGIASWMIVDQDQGRSIEIQAAPDDFARIDRHMIDGAHAKAFVGDQPVLAVQIEDVEPLDGAAHGERVMPKSA